MHVLIENRGPKSLAEAIKLYSTLTTKEAKLECWKLMQTLSKKIK